MIVSILCAIVFAGKAFQILKPLYENLTDEMDIAFLVNFIVANLMTAVIIIFGSQLPALLTIGLTLLATVIFWKFSQEIDGKEDSPEYPLIFCAMKYKDEFIGLLTSAADAVRTGRWRTNSLPSKNMGWQLVDLIYALENEIESLRELPWP